MGVLYDLDKSHSWYGLFTIKIDSEIINAGGRLFYSPENGLHANVIIEEFNQIYKCLDKKQIINECIAYLCDENTNKIIRCTLCYVMIDTEYCSNTKTFHSMKLMPTFCVFHYNSFEMNIDYFDIYIPVWKDFLSPPFSQHKLPLKKDFEVILLENNWKVEFLEAASYTLIDQKELDGVFIGLPDEYMNLNKENTLKLKTKHEWFVRIYPSQPLELNLENLSRIRNEVEKFTYLIAVLINKSVKIERVVISDKKKNLSPSMLFQALLNKDIKEDVFINQLAPVRYSSIENVKEVFYKYYLKYDDFKDIIEILNMNKYENYSKYHFTRIADCLKDIDKQPSSKKQHYQNSILKYATVDMKKEIQLIFKKYFRIEEWKEIGSKVTDLRGLIIHFNKKKFGDSELKHIDIVLYNLTVIFTLLLKAHILSEISVEDSVIKKYLDYHFEQRSIMQKIDE